MISKISINKRFAQINYILTGVTDVKWCDNYIDILHGFRDNGGRQTHAIFRNRKEKKMKRIFDCSNEKKSKAKKAAVNVLGECVIIVTIKIINLVIMMCRLRVCLLTLTQ